MIYAELAPSDELSQGDLIDSCSLLTRDSPDAQGNRQVREVSARVIVLSQACDLALPKTTRVVVATVHDAQELVAAGILKSQTIRDQVRVHRVWGWYFLPVGPKLNESIVNFRELHTISRELVESLIAQGKRICRLVTPYREHMAQHFSTTYSRIALPEPYETQRYDAGHLGETQRTNP